MRNIFALFMFVFSLSYAQQMANSNGWLDTTLLWVSGSGTTIYGSAKILTDAENTRAICKAKDTSVAAFSTDSTKCVWGYQTGALVLNGNSAKDTAWDNPITIDTIKASATVVSFGNVDSSGSLFRPYGHADTSNVAGYLYQSRNFSPEWDMFIRYWAQGLTGNKTGSSVKIVINNARRLFQYYRAR